MRQPGCVVRPHLSLPVRVRPMYMTQAVGKKLLSVGNLEMKMETLFHKGYMIKWQVLRDWAVVLWVEGSRETHA